MLEEVCIVECVGDARGALEFLKRTRPGAVLSDCLLPGGGVKEVLAKADAIGVEVILMSGSPEALAEMGAGGRSCLRKPFSLAELEQVVVAAIGKRA